MFISIKNYYNKIRIISSILSLELFFINLSGRYFNFTRTLLFLMSDNNKKHHIYYFTFISSLIFGIFLGGYACNHCYFGIDVAQLITLIFSISTAYFAQGQVKYAEKQASFAESQVNLTSEQHRLDLISREAKLVIEYQTNSDYFIIRNVGEFSAENIEGELLDYTSGEPDYIEPLEILEGQCIHRVPIPFEWRNSSRIIEIDISYSANNKDKKVKIEIEYVSKNIIRNEMYVGNIS